MGQSPWSLGSDEVREERQEEPLLADKERSFNHAASTWIALFRAALRQSIQRGFLIILLHRDDLPRTESRESKEAHVARAILPSNSVAHCELNDLRFASAARKRHRPSRHQTGELRDR